MFPKTYYVGDLIMPVNRSQQNPVAAATSALGTANVPETNSAIGQALANNGQLPGGQSGEPMVSKADRPAVDMTPLIQLITNTIAPGTWKITDPNGQPMDGMGYGLGGGLGLALMPDFRVACAEARFAANFTRLGFHPGFSLTFTLPRLIGQQKANLMFYTGRRIGGEQAYEWGMADVLVPLADVRKEAIKLAQEIAESAPLAVMSTRETMRRGFADAAEIATERELTEQDWTRKTEDFKEGVKSYAEKRPGNWKNR